MDETQSLRPVNEIRGNCLQKAHATDSLNFFFPLSLTYFLCLLLIFFLLNFPLYFLYISLGTMAKVGGGLEALVTFGEETLN